MKLSRTIISTLVSFAVAGAMSVACAQSGTVNSGPSDDKGRVGGDEKNFSTKPTKRSENSGTVPRNAGPSDDKGRVDGKENNFSKGSTRAPSKAAIKDAGPTDEKGRVDNENTNYSDSKTKPRAKTEKQ